MARFLIEIPHDENLEGCARVIRVFMSTGSHLLTNAEWGCEDGVHVAWLIVDVDSKHEALAIVPPAFRSDAKIVALNKFSLDQNNVIIASHESEPAE